MLTHIIKKNYNYLEDQLVYEQDGGPSILT